MSDQLQGWVRKLPNGRNISALGFGCSSLWAKPDYDEKRAQDVLEACYSNGINHFDTSPSYGVGTGERRLSEFVARVGRDNLIISTKVGSNLIDGKVIRGFDRALMERSFHDSLKRLGLERVDILYLHGPDKPDLTDELYRFFDDLKTKGLIDYSGMESIDAGIFEKMDKTPLDTAMIHYNISNYTTEQTIKRLTDAGKIIVSATVFAQSKFDLRTFIPRDRGSLWYLLRMTKNDPLFWIKGPLLARRLRKFDRSPHQVAAGFVTGHPGITSGLFGTSSADHASANARAGHQPLTTKERLIIMGK
ncbi:aldo/keto reductase [Sphingobium phenoxybenzoativorans]|uniref:Aldo/keto reductase n=1 Tax=Sphingobium phenoxybenzoativorans TaxID=1592790 RepID=A0A975K715_9SPHN|nr:aldo/keto reductase [Sphingobium phenoxybenzoativorans]QUT05672.1 aldo/keto reductase [Sphingobium phenoxybenzoativorans]